MMFIHCKFRNIFRPNKLYVCVCVHCVLKPQLYILVSLCLSFSVLLSFYSLRDWSCLHTIFGGCRSLVYAHSPFIRMPFLTFSRQLAISLTLIDSPFQLPNKRWLQWLLAKCVLRHRKVFHCSSNSRNRSDHLATPTTHCIVEFRVLALFSLLCRCHCWSLHTRSSVRMHNATSDSSCCAWSARLPRIGRVYVPHASRSGYARKMRAALCRQWPRLFHSSQRRLELCNM